MRIYNNPSRFRKEKGVDFDPRLLFDLEQASKQTITIPDIGGVPRYYFHMHNIEKVGIHPQATYGDTPLGVYAYPLDEEHLDKLLNENLPYLSHADYFTVMELVDPEHCLLVDGFITKPGDKIDTNLGFYMAAKAWLPSQETPDNIRATLLRNRIANAGYTSVLSFEGIIHPSEPKQIVFLTSSAFRVVVSSITKALKRVFFPTNFEGVNLNNLSYDKPPRPLKSKTWIRILKEWSVDCAERVIPIWEEWARINLPDHIATARDSLGIIKQYNAGKLEPSDLGVMFYKILAAKDAIAFSPGIFSDTRRRGANAAMLVLSSIEHAAKFSGYTTSGMHALEAIEEKAYNEHLPTPERVGLIREERNWQIESLLSRIYGLKNFKGPT